MAARPVTQIKTVNMDVNNPRLELVHFSTQSTEGDYYDCKKLSQCSGAFASNLTTDDKEIRVNWAILATGQLRVYVHTEEAVTEGYLTIIGKK